MHIKGVCVIPLNVHRDDRGWLTELWREDGDFYYDLPDRQTYPEAKQSTLTMSYPGIIKAFHYHKEQWDYWVCIKGNIQVVLYKEGITEVIYLSEDNLSALVIPPNVLHGYKVLGNEPALLLYHTSKVYDPSNPDEHRVPYDDPAVGFNWSVKMR